MCSLLSTEERDITHLVDAHQERFFVLQQYDSYPNLTQITLLNFSFGETRCSRSAAHLRGSCFLAGEQK